MNCDCIKKLGEAIKKEYGESAVFTNTHITFSMSDNKMGVSFEPLNFKYHPKKGDGSESKKWQKSHIVFNFCPICGKEIRPPKESKGGQ